MTLYQMLKAAQNNDEDSINAIVKKFEPLIKKYSYHLNYYCAESDLIIELLILIKKINLDKFDDDSEGKIINYIKSSLGKKKIDLYRKHVVSKVEEIHIDEDINLIADNFDPFKVSWQDIINILPQKQRMILTLKYVFGYSQSDIARMMNVSRQAVNKAIKKAYRKVKDHLDDNI